MSKRDKRSSRPTLRSLVEDEKRIGSKYPIVALGTGLSVPKADCEFVHFPSGKKMTCEEVLAEMDKRGYYPAIHTRALHLADPPPPVPLHVRICRKICWYLGIDS